MKLVKLSFRSTFKNASFYVFFSCLPTPTRTCGKVMLFVIINSYQTNVLDGHQEMEHNFRIQRDFLEAIPGSGELKRCENNFPPFFTISCSRKIFKNKIPKQKD